MTEESLGPILRVPLYQAVAARLRELIRSDGLRPGERLPPERELARRLGVSRTSLRQALTAIHVMGLVEIRHGDGVFVLRPGEDIIPPIDGQTVYQSVQLVAVNEVREGLESQAARLAARRRSKHDLEALALALGEMANEVAVGGVGLRGDRLFHTAVIAAAQSPMLESLLTQLVGSIERVARASLERAGQPARSLDTHREIYDAIEQHDEAAAQELMLNHLLITGEMTLDSEVRDVR
ncbi:MAG: FadR/GntR family transcriptional regulator [Thermoleophilaceae bacterium]